MDVYSFFSQENLWHSIWTFDFWFTQLVRLSGHRGNGIKGEEWIKGCLVKPCSFSRSKVGYYGGPAEPCLSWLTCIIHCHFPVYILFSTQRGLDLFFIEIILQGSESKFKSCSLKSLVIVFSRYTYWLMKDISYIHILSLLRGKFCNLSRMEESTTMQLHIRLTDTLFGVIPHPICLLISYVWYWYIDLMKLCQSKVDLK